MNLLVSGAESQNRTELSGLQDQRIAINAYSAWSSEEESNL